MIFLLTPPYLFYRFFFVGACPKCTENSRATYTNDLVKERGIARVKSSGTRMGNEL